MSGRGRGRGRGRGGGGAAARRPPFGGEDGELLARKIEGPPPLFPPVDLPERPDITSVESTRLVERRRNLLTFWNESAYYVEPPAQTSELAADIEHYLNRSKPGPQVKRKPLSLYLQLSSAFFPAELIGNQRKRRRTDQQGMWTLQNSTKSDLGRLDKLATLEQKKGDKDDKGDGEGEGEGEEDEADQDIAYEEDEYDEDDYGKNETFDDDEEYDFDDGGGDDEGPTY